MQNLRIKSFQVVNSTSIEVVFTDKLTSNLTTSNVSILSDTQNVEDPSVLKIEVSGYVICRMSTINYTSFLFFCL